MNLSGKRTDPAREAQVVALYKRGDLYSHIRNVTGTSDHTISRILARHGVPRDRRQRGGPAHPLWKGGRTKAGYVLAYVAPNSQFAPMRNRANAVFKHRLVMACYLGRCLRADEEVHHVNGNRADNRLENLQLRVKGHGAGVVLTCERCGSHAISAEPL